MKRLVALAVAALTLCAIFAGTALAAKDKDAVTAMVKEAVAVAEKEGRDAVIAKVNDAKGKFVRGELYVFIYDMQATMMAHPMNPKLIGQNLLEAQDIDGKRFRKDIVEIASAKGGGWVDYKYKNPKSGMIEEKTTYFEKAGDLIICCGTYK